MDSGSLDTIAREIAESLLGDSSVGTRPASAQLPAESRAQLAAPPAPVSQKPEEIAALIDHTLLKSEATDADIRRICAEARLHRFASVCVSPVWVSLAAKELEGSPVKVCTVAGFPLGATFPEVKALEAEIAVRNGAREIDMVMNIGALRGGDLKTVERDIAAVCRAVHSAGAIVKVILETPLLDDVQKIVACTVARLAGADFVKTCTGFGPGGATTSDVALLRRVAGTEMGVKASGGIRTLEQLRAVVDAGANRIGTSNGVSILESLARC